MAETVCGPADEVGGDVLDRLGELVDQSLVRLDEEPGEPRFAMLETIREYAAEMLAARGEADAIARRHADGVPRPGRGGGAAPVGRGPAAWLDRLEREHDNLRAALDWATDHDPALAVDLAFALWRFWQQRGYLNEARARLERDGRAGLGARTGRPGALRRGVRRRSPTGSPTGRRPSRWYDEALAIWRTLGDRARDRQRPVQPRLRRHDRGDDAARRTGAT